MKKQFLIVATDPSPNTRRLRERALAAVEGLGLEDTAVRLQTPEATTARHVLDAHGLLIGTTENIGYMAGLTKDLFDRCFYEWEGKTDALPVGFYIRAGLDGTATRKALESITGGLNWRLVQPPLILRGSWDDRFPDQVGDLAMTLAAGIDAGMY